MRLEDYSSILGRKFRQLQSFQVWNLFFIVFSSFSFSFFFLTESAYPTKLLLQSIMWNIQIIEKDVSSYQNLGFPPAAQISTILSEIRAVRSLEFKLLAVLLPLIWIIVSQNLSNNPSFYWNLIAIFKISASIL